MKQYSIFTLLMAAALTFGMTACQDDDTDDFSSYINNPTEEEEPADTASTDPADTSVVEPVVESGADTIYVVYNGSTATVSGDANGYVSVSGADVTVNALDADTTMLLVVSGTSTDGSLLVYRQKKFYLRLNGLTLTNPDGPAINNQCGKTLYVETVSGTTNTLTDGSTYSDAPTNATGEQIDQKGALFSEGQIYFTGSGTLTVNGNAKNGIASDDYIKFRPGNNIYVLSTSGHGIKANDSIIVNGGVINVETSALAGKGMKSDGLIAINGGRTTLITTGKGEYDSDERDVKGAAGIGTDSVFVMNAGELYCMSSGAGGKGIKADQDVYINGGTIRIITTGNTYSYTGSTCKAKGIKADGNLTVSGGDIMVRTTGDSGSEGIESKKTITIDGGQTAVYAVDDAINSKSHLYIKDGNIFAWATSNDAIDANGNLYIQGGTTVAYGTSSPECGIDANEEGGYAVIISGGTLAAVGGGTSYPSSSSTQPSIVYGGQVAAGTTVTLNGSNNLLALTMQRAFNGTACFLFTTPGLTKGTAYTINTGATATGTDWYGLRTAATVSAAGTEAASISSLSTPYTSCGTSTGGMGGGMMPGGRR